MQKIEKTSFIQAVRAVCVTREIFLRLKNQSIWRTFLHLSFLAFLCSCFIMLAGHEAMLKKIEAPLDLFEASTGGIICKNGAIYPEKEPNKAFELMLLPRIKLIYSPDFNQFKADWINKNGISMLWFPNFWCLTITQPERQIIKSFSGFPDSSMQDMTEHENRDDLMTYLAKRNAEAQKKKHVKDDRTLIVSRLEIERMYLGGNFFYFWFEFCFQTLFLTVLFSIFYRFVGGRGITGLTFREIFCSGFYVAIPPMLIATFFPAFDLPFIPFETVFIVSYLIYFICVLNYLERMTGAKNTLSKQGD